MRWIVNVWFSFGDLVEQFNFVLIIAQSGNGHMYFDGLGIEMSKKKSFIQRYKIDINDQGSIVFSLQPSSSIAEVTTCLAFAVLIECASVCSR